MLFGYNAAKNLTKTELVLEWIKQSTFMFYPTGSRYFGNVTETSDWDYFAQNCVELQRELEEAGFKLETESYQGDPVIIQVWALHNVHVQLVKNARHKQRIQWDLLPLFRSLKPSKDDAKRLWNVATKLYLDGYEEGVRDTVEHHKTMKK